MEIIVGKTAGFCLGVKRAVEGSIKEAEKSSQKIYCLGELVHNKEVVKTVEEKGITTISDINEIKEKNVKMIIRAHGIDKKIYSKAKKNEIDVIDYTCPLVSRIHNIAEEYQEQGYYIFFVGNKIHPETIGTVSHCGSNYSIVENEEEIEIAISNFSKTEINKLLVIVQTTFSTHRFKNIEKIIKEKIDTNVELVIKNTICKTTEQRQKETEELSQKVDLMIVIGGKNSSNTKKIYDIAEKYTKSLLIETEKELDIKQLNKYNKIGIMAGASTPMEAINGVVNKFSKLELS